MKQVVQNFKTGQLSVEEVPAPTLIDGRVLVENRYSLISTGTEKSTVKVGKASILGKARQRPDLVKQVLNNLRREGFASTYKKVRTKLGSLKALGYSTSGIVVASMDKDGVFKPGDRVACAGQDYASHAEIVSVPQNLVARIPDSVSFEQASFTTLGAIAIQALRQCDPKLGENVCVIGLGLLGQITNQLLLANGCRVFGIDLDSRLVDLMKEMGAHEAMARDNPDLDPVLDHFTRGRGFDSVIIAAATSSNDPVVLATKILRKKGRIVIVGDVKMDVPREPHFYQKELELKMSASYGPGRYDPEFEELGRDYPYDYVRWTEQRNMEAFLGQLESQAVSVKPLVSHVFKVEEAEKAYDLVLGRSNHESLGILLEYPVDRKEKLSQKVIQRTFEPAALNIGFIGAGSFAQSYLLPHIRAWGASLHTVVTTRSLTSSSAASKFGFGQASTNPDDVFSEPSIDTIFIATRHDSHAPLVLEGLRNGKNVFVEKPLALDLDQLKQLKQAVAECKGRLMVGFNRRFSPAAKFVKDDLEGLDQPLMFNYRVSADKLEPGHWILDPGIGGGRIVGEVCHFIDLIQFLTGSDPAQVFATTTANDNRGLADQDNVTIGLRMSDGSNGQILYTSLGNKNLPKERLEIFCGGRAWIIDDFKRVTSVVGSGKNATSVSGKGHKEEVFRCLDAIKQGSQVPISFHSLYLTTLATFKIRDSLSTNLPQSVAPPND